MTSQSAKTPKTLLLVIAALFIQACSYPVIDNALIQRPQAEPARLELNIGKEVEGATYYPYLIGYNFSDSIEAALDSAGEDYDLLINASVEEKYYYLVVYFSKYVIVKGTAIKSSELKASLGEEGFKRWLATQNVVITKE